MTLLTRTQLRIQRDNAARRLQQYLETDPWALADELREALFLLDERPTDSHRVLLEGFGGA